METISSGYPHVQQTYNWDCGLACLKMLLSHLSRDVTLIKTYMAEIGLSNSVWTVDLAYILSRYGVSSTLFTLSIEVQDDYANMSYYKAKFLEDKTRVERLFKEADAHGFNSVVGHIEMTDVADKLADDNTAIIALVDWNMIKCSHCGDDVMQVCSRACSKLLCMSKSYQGHYILVTGVNLEDDKVMFQNPGRTSGGCYCSVNMFDRARTAVGTDEDLLVIQLPT